MGEQTEFPGSILTAFCENYERDEDFVYHNSILIIIALDLRQRTMRKEGRKRREMAAMEL